MINYNRRISIILVIALVICGLIMYGNIEFSFADSSEVYALDSLSTIEPVDSDSGNMNAKGGGVPISTYNIAKKGEYHFSTDGHNNNNVLYTNYRFYGKTRYDVKITNNNDVPVLMQAKNSTHTYNQMRVNPRTTVTISVITGDTSKKFYVKFSSDGDDLNFFGRVY